MDDKNSLLLAVFSRPQDMVEGVKAVQDHHNEVLEVLSPVPVPEVDDLLPQRPSMVRWFTLLGCISGGVLGMGFQIMTVLQWPHLTGGKPVVSLPAFVVVSFEMTILFGAIATFIGLLLNAGLPQVIKENYYKGCARSDFALVIRHDPADRENIENTLRKAGAHEVRPAKPGSVLLGVD